MTRRFAQVCRTALYLAGLALALACATALPASHPVAAATPSPKASPAKASASKAGASKEAPPSGPEVAAALAYVRAYGSGDYPKAFAMLSSYAQKYFGSARSYGSVWSVDQFKVLEARAIKIVQQKNVKLILVGMRVSYLDPQQQVVKQSTFAAPYGIVKENGAYRVDDEQHPYRSFAPSGITVEHDGGRVTVRKLSFFSHHIEVFITFENHGDGFITFLPYGRTVFRDESAVYQPYDTNDQYLTDRQLFLGLRLASSAAYTGPMNFQVDHRMDDQARTYTLRIAPALRDGADAPLEFDLPPIAVPAP